MDFPWYVITGDINLKNFSYFSTTVERGFIWRGFTQDYEMIPPAANYDRYGYRVTNRRTEECQPLMEIQRVSQKIYELNKLQRFPFDIPLLIRTVLFSGFYQKEEKLFKEMGITEFPDSSLTQSLSLVQHEFSGTSLLDFSIDKYKALYFAIGKEDNFSEDSKIFGLNVPFFEAHKKELTEEVFGEYSGKFDLLYPSYFMNDKIAHQDGVFLYQKFKVDKSGYIVEDKKYENIIKYFESRFEKDKKLRNPLYKEISLDDFLKLTDKEGRKYIFYILLTVPAKEKRVLKAFLNTIGITDNYMMNTVVTKDTNIECDFIDGYGI